MKFFTNKYPIKNVIAGKNPSDNYSDIKEGSIFAIDGINGSMFELKPVNDLGKCCSVMVDAQMLSIGFTETDYVG